MSLPGDSPVMKSSMPRQLPAPARSLADVFSRSLLSFQNSSSNLQILCTAGPTEQQHHGAAPTQGDDQPAPLSPRSRPRTLIVLDSSFNPPTRAHLRMATSAIHDLTHTHGQPLGTLRLLLLLSVNNADKGVKPAAFDKRLAMMWAFARDVQHSFRGVHEDEDDGQGLASVGGPPQASAGAGETPLHVDLALAKMPYFHEKSAALAGLDFYKGTNDGAGETEQVFLAGYDTLIRIFNPKYYGPQAESATQLASPESSPMWKALGPFFGRAKLRVIMRTGDEWGNEEQQRAYLEGLLKAEGLGTGLVSKGLGSRIEMVDGRKAGEDVISSTLARAAAKARDGDRLGLMVTAGVRWWIEQEDLYTEP
ncbi:uncharacterized protein B0T15DRAFT_224794 [Chaetomium strumarium]|uniref:Nicotinamide-nucleotide adenylyltransferase n=1 Tax=Chaetomium strumarium TaxID=1170767 RepID=A0AAJ0GPW3_9PEZI|nr:hypothetical protein B0T15DRAFT_224794 [Chaetomium strumarium]